MSVLREQIQSAREQYRQLCYSGDLAAEVMPGRWRMRRWMGAGALAAAVALAVWLHRSPVMEQQVAARSETSLAWGALPAVSLSEFPEGLSLVPPAQSMEIPGVSLSWSDVAEQGTGATTQEAL
jgi:hypothetical protein